MQQITRLQCLNINRCPQLVQLRCPPSLETLSVKNCKSIVQLPQRLGDLTSLKNLEISNCEGVKALPESIQQLTCLQYLKINGCPQLVWWCKSHENKMKLAHIKKIVRAPNLSIIMFFICIDYSFYHVTIRMGSILNYLS
jgi:Leucine-rich repeat (LRR) protein